MNLVRRATPQENAGAAERRLSAREASKRRAALQPLRSDAGNRRRNSLSLAFGKSVEKVDRRAEVARRREMGQRQAQAARKTYREMHKENAELVEEVAALRGEAQADKARILELSMRLEDEGISPDDLRRMPDLDAPTADALEEAAGRLDAALDAQRQKIADMKEATQRMAEQAKVLLREIETFSP